MTSIGQESPMLPKRAKELEKELEELHKGFKDAYKERWEEFHKEENPRDCHEKKEFKKKQSFLLHLRRSISWLDRAQQMEKDNKKTDKDLAPQFIFLWIGFNALYGRDPHQFFGREKKLLDPKERQEERKFRKYFDNLFEHSEDTKERIYKVINNDISKQVISLSENIFVWPDFWKYHHDIQKTEKHLPMKGDWLPKPLKKTNTKRILHRVFECLYVLRNQLIHGASTWDGNLNKEQLIDGTEIVYYLLPVFIDIMLKTPKDEWKKWGRVWYPRVKGVDIEGEPYKISQKNSR